MTSVPIQELTAQLADRMMEQANVQNVLTGISDEIQAIRDELQVVMKANSYKSLEENGLQVSIRSKGYPQVANPDALKAHIEGLGLLPDYTVTRYDENKAKRDGAKKGWPGIEVEDREELVVKAVAK